MSAAVKAMHEQLAKEREAFRKSHVAAAKESKSRFFKLWEWFAYSSLPWQVALLSF